MLLLEHLKALRALYLQRDKHQAQAIQTGVQETAKQATALMDNTGITDQISNIQQNIPNPNISSGLGQVNVTQPTTRTGGIEPILVPDPVTRATFGSQ